MKITPAEYVQIRKMVKCNGALHCTVLKCPHKDKHFHNPMNCSNHCKVPEGVLDSTCKEVEDGR